MLTLKQLENLLKKENKVVVGEKTLREIKGWLDETARQKKEFSGRCSNTGRSKKVKLTVGKILKSL